MSSWIILLNGLSVSLFGIILSASFCGTLDSRQNRRIIGVCIIAVPLLQGWAVSVWDTEFLRQIYPLIVHLPLLLILAALTKRLLFPTFCTLSS